jgi:hypothetical protein
MSVGFTNAVVAGLRYNGVPVSFEPGWETKGNGFSFVDGKPEGLVVHHTGSAYDSGLSVLINGRPDLGPPLCNSSGYRDGRIHIIAAHPANHAGASGGKSMGPLPVTRLFNSRVWGHEIMYPGLQPWSKEQYRSARVLAGVISGILKRPNHEWARGHGETSITGKWDPGLGNGSSAMFPMSVFRAEVWAALKHETAPIPSPAVVKEDELNFFDISGKGHRVIPCPTGSASANNRKAWLSASLIALDGPCWIRVYAQGFESGVHDWMWTEKDLAPIPAPVNRTRRAPMQVKSPTSNLAVSWDLTNAPQGATLLLETIA